MAQDVDWIHEGIARVLAEEPSMVFGRARTPYELDESFVAWLRVETPQGLREMLDSLNWSVASTALIQAFGEELIVEAGVAEAAIRRELRRRRLAEREAENTHG